MTGATEAWMDDDDNLGGFSSSDDDQVAEDEIPNKISEEKIKQEAAVEIEESAEIKAIAKKIEPEKDVLESKAAISLPMTGATEAWMDDDDNFGGFSSSDEDQVNENKMPKAMPETNIKEVLESKAAISLPMIGATEAWMDDDDNFGGFSSSDDDQVDEDKITNTIQEEQIKEKATVEIEDGAEMKAIAEKEILKSKAAISLPMTGATEAW